MSVQDVGFRSSRRAGRRTGSARSRSASIPTRSSTGSSRSASSRGRPGTICASPPRSRTPATGSRRQSARSRSSSRAARTAPINAFVNRCAHRGNLLCLTNKGHGKEITCIYHGWSYDLEGHLTGVAFEHGVKRQGGMPPEFRKEEHHLQRLRVAELCGLVFGTFDPTMSRTSKPISARSWSAA